MIQDETIRGFRDVALCRIKMEGAADASMSLSPTTVLDWATAYFANAKAVEVLDAMIQIAAAEAGADPESRIQRWYEQAVAGVNGKG